ncbi:DUF488 family protein [Bosea sp. 124]|uniref:DUF488 domain-containing protein n=1 Tax=Bosea sp. 124 TaxID=2135642 RepID=UPI000D372A72|nr:DUF488 family protein [Bosea sp. 124]PTM42451.1 uncharacterized protein YeaO (DUF488 family) [Bosea sp. 124]
MTRLSLKRVYDPPAETDGTRILVDRLWPRGVSKDRIDLWLKDLAPSDDLRRQFHGQLEHWDTFRAAYAAELGGAKARAALGMLNEKRQSGPVTLLYAARDEQHNNAEALALWLASQD